MKKFSKSWLAALAIATVFGCQPKATETAEGTSADESAAAEVTESEQRPSPLIVEEGQIGDKAIKVHYGSPSVKGRVIWGDLVPYNIVWRTGANEASYVEIPQDISVEGNALAAGKYSLFTIPKETGAWTVIFNSDWNLEHGHFQYDDKKDVLRVEAMPIWEQTSTEQLTMKIESPGLVIRWDKLKLPISIQ
ncbi:DUF2911 domain-containing protein [Algoriphagus jejuensis]|uniref:DUF2911 domain-containing protein n=1 Tax=Algoriphagus jejuensis TaxID=419934 RepID=A0ABN1N4V8_9BACT